MKNLQVQVLDEQESKRALDILRKSDKNASASECYIRGNGSDENIEELRKMGLIVEVLPTNTDLKWMEPDEEAQDEASFQSESVPEEDSSLVKMAAKHNEVCLLQLEGPLRAAWKTELEKAGVELLSYKPDFAYKVVFNGDSRKKVETLGYVSRIVELQSGKSISWLKSQIKNVKRIATERAEEAEFEERNGSRSDRRHPRRGGTFEMAPFAGDEIDMGPGFGEAEAMPDLMSDEPAEAGGPSAAAEPAIEEPLRTFDLKCHAGDQIETVAAAMKKDDRVRNVRAGKLRIRFDCDENSPVLDELLGMTQLVSKIEPYIEPTLTNNYVRIDIGLEKGDPAVALPWTGKNQIVAVADSGVDAEHPDIKNKLFKVVQKAPDVSKNDPNGHGTHVCGIIAGDGTASDGLFHGVAKDAKLFVQELLDSQGRLTGLPLDLGDLFQEAYDAGARIHNNSWGVPAGGRYSIDSHEVDEFIYEHPDFLVVFSAGNDGTQVDNEQIIVNESGRILYWSLRSPATSKNALTVGASCSSRPDGPFKEVTWENYPHNPPYSKPPLKDELVSGNRDTLAAFSSRGPCDDDRIKPDLVAPGTVILSSLSQNSSIGTTLEGKFNDKYTFISGTSQAAPVVAGAAAIVREYYTSERDHEPSAALLRATLVNGTTWISTSMAMDDEVGEPNFHQGFGRLNLENTLPVKDGGNDFDLFFADIDRKSPKSLNRNKTSRARWNKTIEVEKGWPLRVTVAWTDKPGHGLQQNLDLVVVTPDNSRLVGNMHLRRRSFEQWDRDNNIESLIIPEPVAGSYNIFVIAYNTPFEDQGFSIVATGKLSGDNFPG